MAACDSAHAQQPTPEDVKRLRAPLVHDARTHLLESFVVSDLSCTSPHADQKAQVVAGYKFMGADANDFVKAYANCSYVVNGLVKGKKEWLQEGKDTAFKNVKMENDLFLFVMENGEGKWRAYKPRRVPGKYLGHPTK